MKGAYSKGAPAPLRSTAGICSHATRLLDLLIVNVFLNVVITRPECAQQTPHPIFVGNFFELGHELGTRSLQLLFLGLEFCIVLAHKIIGLWIEFRAFFLVADEPFEEAPVEPLN